MAVRVLVLLGFIVMVNGSLLENRSCVDPNSNSCGGRNSGCSSSASCLTVQWVQMIPYIYENAGIAKGVLPSVLYTLLKACCHDCSWTVNLTKVEKATLNVSDVVFPYKHSQGETSIGGMDVVTLFQNPSVVYITKRLGTKGIPGQLLKAIWNAWPVLIVALLLSLHAGVLLWLMEFWNNPEEFPASFTKGSWEGFWWAFVSMTTVGYGDRAPRSILGRAFAICWILIGICICSIFTATLTTALTTISLEEVKTVSRAKIGAIRNSLEATTGVENQAKVIPYNTSEQLWKALLQDQVEGILLESSYSATPSLSARIQDDNLKISQTITAKGWAYGMLVADSDLAQCFNGEILNMHNEINDLLTEEIQSEEAAENEAAKRSSSIFDPTGDVFWPTLYVCIAFAVIIIVLGVVWQLVLLPKIKRKTAPSKPSGSPSNLDRMEKEMIGEVQRLFNEWKVKMGEKPPELIELS